MQVRSGNVRWLVWWRIADAGPDLIDVHYTSPVPGGA
jgi:hypothetical protein